MQGALCWEYVAMRLGCGFGGRATGVRRPLLPTSRGTRSKVASPWDADLAHLAEV